MEPGFKHRPAQLQGSVLTVQQQASEMTAEIDTMPCTAGVAPECLTWATLPQTPWGQVSPHLSRSSLNRDGDIQCHLNFFIGEIKLGSSVGKEVLPFSIILHGMCSDHVLKNPSWPVAGQEGTVMDWSIKSKGNLVLKIHSGLLFIFPPWQQVIWPLSDLHLNCLLH